MGITTYKWIGTDCHGLQVGKSMASVEYKLQVQYELWAVLLKKKISS